MPNSAEGCGIYIHIPFCHSRCLYCAFYSSVGKSGLHSDYFEALKREAFERREWLLSHAPVRTVYWGGGTPSLPDARLIVDFMETLRQSLGDAFRPDEITLEVNPEDVDAQKLELWTKAGINRYSMGVQTLVPAELKSIGRRHTVEQVKEAAKLLRNAGDLSLDLICGLPHQTLDSFAYSLEGVLEMNPHHLSVYLLELEADTALTRLIKGGRLSVPDEEAVEQMYMLLCQRLKDAGFTHYEISNFALPGHHSRHNSAYWSGRPYVGLGAGAAGYLNSKLRCVNKPDLNSYISQGPTHELEHLTDTELSEEYILTRLRTCQGICLADYERRFGADMLRRLCANAKQHINAGNLVLDLEKGFLRLSSPKACMLSDAIMVDLML